MQIVTYNIQWGKGRDGVVDLGRIARTVAAADVIALQEVERHWRDMPDADEVARLSELLPGHHPVFCPSVDFHAPGPRGQRRQYGLMVLSRWPVQSLRAIPLPHGAVLGHVSDPAILMECVIGHPTFPFRLYVTHLNWISPALRLGQCEAILAAVEGALRAGPPISGSGAPDSDFGDDWMMIARDELPPMPAPALLTGDFNMTPGSAEYACLCGPLVPGAGRLVETGRFADALTRAGLTEDAGITFPGEAAGEAMRIDHVLCSPDLALRLRRAWIDAEATGSDHQPVWAEFAVPGE